MCLKILWKNYANHLKEQIEILHSIIISQAMNLLVVYCPMVLPVQERLCIIASCTFYPREGK